MKSFGFSRSALSSSVIVALLAGCGGSQPSIGASGATPQNAVYTQTSRAQNATASSSIVHFVYVANYAYDNVSAFAINASSGSLTQVPGSPFEAGRFPIAVVIDPTGTFAYVANP
jgi:6-phosphogluconolactonase (cycloisomerase 2 family)